MSDCHCERSEAIQEKVLDCRVALCAPRNDSTINGRPIFKNNLEKYDWFIKNEPDNDWIAEFKTGKEYQLFYGVEI